MLLAQTTENILNNPWTQFGGFITILGTVIGKLWNDFRKDKRDLALDANKQRVLERIADSNDRIHSAQIEVKATLESSQIVTKVYHETLLMAVRESCKAQGKIQPRERL